MFPAAAIKPKTRETGCRRWSRVIFRKNLIFVPVPYTQYPPLQFFVVGWEFVYETDYNPDAQDFTVYPLWVSWC